MSISTIARATAFIWWTGFGLTATAQSQGPRNPASTGNNAGIGSTAWTIPGNSVSSNDTYSTVLTQGISQYLTVSNFGFTIPSTSGIAGIQLDVERSTSGSSDVALLNAWSTGLTKTVSAGINRCLLVAYAQENGTGSRDITALTYGGRNMVQVADYAAGTSGGFMARIEVWMLLESDIGLAGTTTIVPTYGGYTALEYCESFSAAVFQNVDQLTAVTSVQGGGALGNTNPHQLGAAITTLAGSMAVNVVTAGNNSTPGVTNGGTNTYTINSGYTEGTDQYFANTGVAPTSGACFQTAYKAVATNGTEQPQCTFNGPVNRWAMVGLTLQRARELDHAVKLMKGGTIGGADLASLATWPTSDAYLTYGGATTLWGLDWTPADINASNFGAAVAARVQNGTARVDHVRITVYYYSLLPIELLDFSAMPSGNNVSLEWSTASEHDNHHFIVQRSRDGVSFEDVAQVPGAGNSQTLLRYGHVDERPYAGTGYYRLVQVDMDGSLDPSPTVSVAFLAEDLSIYPNPTSDGAFTIHHPATEDLDVRVYDSAMRLVSRSALKYVDPIVHLGDLPDGTYTVVIHAGDELHASRVVKSSRTQ